MIILALIERPELSLVSTQLVYSAKETGALRTAVQSAEHLAKLHQILQRIDSWQRESEQTQRSFTVIPCARRLSS